jgi:hypothetical protein
MTRRIVIVVLGALGFVACRPGEGEYCRCPDECRRGLVCAQSGAVIDACIDPGPGEQGGRCIEADGAVQMNGDDDSTALVDYYEDEGGKRDFEPGSARDDESSGGGTSTSGETTTSDTSTTTGTSTTTDTSATSDTSTTTGTQTSGTGP